MSTGVPHPPTPPTFIDAPALRTLRVEARSRGYDVLIGDGMRLAPELAGAIRGATEGARRAMLVTDAGIVAAGVTGAVGLSLSAAGLEVVQGGTLRPSEEMKAPATVERLLGAMASARLDRRDVVVVLGGGVLGDLVGFAAATYRRGVRWINMPSTLLAMVDASVGGKTGVNLLVNGGLKKNMVGAFWQPSLVAADVGLLASLEERHFRAGLAECIKHGMIAADWGDEGLGEWTAEALPGILARDSGTLIELVARNIAIKARVVGVDEREEADGAEEGPGGRGGRGGRAVLNLGHTFGHIMETLPGLSASGDAGTSPCSSPLHHGEAVGLGLVAASAAAAGMGLCGDDLPEKIRAAVGAAGLPTRVGGLPPLARLIDLMMDDKKVEGGRLRLVLPCGGGRARVVADPPVEAVEAGWSAIRGS